MANELTLTERAALALGTPKHETELVLLVAESRTIEAIKNKDGREQCHSMAMQLKTARTSIQKAGKMAREDAQAFSKAVIAEEKRLIDIIEPDEKRLLSLRDAYDAEQERIKQEAIEAERLRVQQIKEKIALLQNAPLMYATATHAQVELALDNLSATVIDSTYAEFQAEALNALHQATAKMQELSDAAHQREQEAARVQAEREALSKMRAEIEARRLEQERLAAEEKAKQDAEMQAQRAAMEAERKVLEAQAQALREQAAQMEREKAEAAELARIAALPVDDVVDADFAEVAIAPAPSDDEMASDLVDLIDLTPAITEPTEAEIFAVLMDYYDTDEETIRGWLHNIVKHNVVHNA